MSDKPPLRKRSEIGKVIKPGGEPPLPMQRAEDSFAEFEATTAAQQSPPVENLSEFCQSLKAKGVEVSLIVAAKWSVEERVAVRKWLVTMDANAIPECVQSAGLFARKLAQDAAPAVSKNDPGDDALYKALSAQGLLLLMREAVSALSASQKDIAREWLRRGAEMENIPDWLEVYIPNTLASSPLPVAPPKPWAPPEEKPLVGVKRETKGDLAPAVMPAPSVQVDAVECESGDFNRLIETVLKEIDLDREYNELEALLEVGDNRRDYATVYDALDKAERRALRAHALWANALLEYKILKIDQEQVDADLYKEASAALEAEKAEGKRAKAITISDVQAKIAESFPDEWRGAKIRLARAELAVHRCERFSDLWSQKVRSLNTMVNSVRK